MAMRFFLVFKVEFVIYIHKCLYSIKGGLWFLWWLVKTYHCTCI